jgi:hypothetical protein
MRCWLEGNRITKVQNGLVQGIDVPDVAVEGVECKAKVAE